MSTSNPLPIRRANREAAAALCAGFLITFGIYGYFWARLYRGYLLIRDDPGNIGGTVDGAFGGWFTRGMAGYYHVYPEWAQPGFSNFYRPFWNLILYVEQALLGQHYWAWFLAFCAVQFCATLLFLRVLRSLGVPHQPALLFALLFLFNPAFLNLGLVYPGSQFDVFVSLLLLAAFRQLLEARFAPALALIGMAVFTKETAIFAPIAAAITVFILKRDLKWSAAMLAPLVAWIVARWLAYHAVMGGTFASPANLHDLLANIAKGLIVWPSGAVESLRLHLADANGIVQIALLLMNAALWAILIYAGWQVVRALRQAPLQTGSKLQAILLIWTLGALSFCMLTRPQTRFGACLYVFLLLFLACSFFVRSQPTVLKLTAIAILSCVAVIRGGNFLLHAVANVSEQRADEQARFEGLRALPQDGRAVFVVNAPTMLSAPRFVAKMWRLKLAVSFLNQMPGCTIGGPSDATYDLSRTDLSVKIPPCAHYVFAGVPVDIQAKAARGSLLRPGIGTYRFADRSSGRLDSGDIDFERHMRIALARPATILAYDWQDAAYRVLSPTP